ncbi:MAG: hypothetical protein ACT4TC_22960 [Myxococcaceae bacterium]
MTGPIRSDAQRTREAYANALDNVSESDGQYELDDEYGPDFENSSFEGISPRGPRTSDPRELHSQNRPNREVSTVDATRTWLTNSTPDLANRFEMVLLQGKKEPFEHTLLITNKNGTVFNPLMSLQAGSSPSVLALS